MKKRRHAIECKKLRSKACLPFKKKLWCDYRFIKKNVPFSSSKPEIFPNLGFC